MGCSHKYILYILSIFYVSIALMVSTRLIAQKGDDMIAKKSMILYLEPNIGYRSLNYNGVNSVVEIERNDNEVGRIGFVFGIGLRNRLAKKYSLSYGIQYMEYGHNGRYQNLKFTEQNGSYPIKSKSSIFYQSIGIPMSVQYHFLSNKLKHYIKLGMESEFILQKTSETSVEYNDRTTNEEHRFTLGYRSIQISALLGVGLSYKMNDKIEILGEPLYRSQLTSINRDETAKERPYTIGFNIQLIINLKK
jgi:hypothetical protein